MGTRPHWNSEFRQSKLSEVEVAPGFLKKLKKYALFPGFQKRPVPELKVAIAVFNE
jgi:hypothetical protein